MKVTLRRENDGGYSIYVPKKDLEAQVVEADNEPPWGGTVLLDSGQLTT